MGKRWGEFRIQTFLGSILHPKLVYVKSECQIPYPMARTCSPGSCTAGPLLPLLSICDSCSCSARVVDHRFMHVYARVVYHQSSHCTGREQLHGQLVSVVNFALAEMTVLVHNKKSKLITAGQTFCNSYT